MTRYSSAVGKTLTLTAIITLVVVTRVPAATAEPQALEELANYLKEAKDTLGMLVILYLWIFLAAGITAITLIARASFVDLTNQLDFLARSVRAGRSAAIGVLNFVIILTLALGLLNVDPSGVTAAVLLLFVAVMVCIGLLATTPALGEKVLSLKGDESSEFGRISAGNAALFTAAVVPVLGWMFFLHIVMKSLGLGLIWLVRRKTLAREVSHA